MCGNELVVRRDTIEQELISGLQREVLREDVAAFALEEFKRQLRARLEDTRSHLATMQNKREKLKTEIAVPAHNSISTWRHEAHQTDERPCATLRYGGAGGPDNRTTRAYAFSLPLAA